MDPIDRIRSALLAGKKTTVQGNRLVERLCHNTRLERDVVIKCLMKLRETGEVVCASWYRGEPIGRVQLTIERQHTEGERLWEKVLVDEGVSERDREALLGLGSKLDGWERVDLKRLLHGLTSLRNDLPGLHGQPRYLISARYLLGSSKMLDAMPAYELSKYGIELDCLSGPPSYVVVAGPNSPECVVLVENPQAMEMAIQAEGGADVAWVATFGYGLSRHGDEYGKQLASVVEQRCGLTSLVRQGTPPAVETLLSHPRLYFWGDLDREGLRIYWRLKSSLPHLKLSGLYNPMQSMIESSDNHHAYAELAAKSNQSGWQCQEESVQKLLYICNHRAVDQEALDAVDIRKYARFAYQS